MAGNGNGRSSKHWGPPPQKDGPGGRWFGPGEAAGHDTLSGAMDELAKQHPHDMQGENLPHERYNARHDPVTSSTYAKRHR